MIRNLVRVSFVYRKCGFSSALLEGSEGITFYRYASLNDGDTF